MCFVSQKEYDFYERRHWREIEKNGIFRILRFNGESDMMAMLEAAAIMTDERKIEYALLCHATDDGRLEVKNYGSSGSRFYSAEELVDCFERISQTEVDDVYIWADLCYAHTLLVELEKEIDLRQWPENFVMRIIGYDTINGEIDGRAHMDSLRLEENGSMSSRFVHRYNRVAPKKKKIIGETMVKLEANKCHRKYYSFD